MTNENGWTMEEWKMLHELKIKANSYNLEQAISILRKETQIRAERTVLINYLK